MALVERIHDVAVVREPIEQVGVIFALPSVTSVTLPEVLRTVHTQPELASAPVWRLHAEGMTAALAQQRLDQPGLGIAGLVGKSWA